MACLPMMLLAPLAASLIQMAISRAREFEAGRGGSPISGDPHGSAGVLLQIHRVAPRGTLLPPSEAHPETAQMMIVNPPSAGGLRGLFSTHPAVEERVERLLAMGNG